MTNLPKQKLLNVEITNASEREILEYIITGLKEGSGKYYIVTPNPEILVFANKHPEFKRALNNAQLALPDGTGVMWAGRILGISFKERVTGTDLLEKLCSRVNEKPITVGFLGGREKIAEQTVKCLVSKFSNLKVVFVASEWGEEGFLEAQNLMGNKDSKNVAKEIDILFVAFGFPKQEEWMAKNLEKIPVNVAIGVGGAFDYISGKVPRAPIVIRRLGFEWLYRLIHQPWRLKRQLALLEFIFLVLKEKFFPNKTSS